MHLAMCLLHEACDGPQYGMVSPACLQATPALLHPNRWLALHFQQHVDYMPLCADHLDKGSVLALNKRFGDQLRW